MSTDQLTPAETFTMAPRELELAILAGRCDVVLLQIPRTDPPPDHGHAQEIHRHA